MLNTIEGRLRLGLLLFIGLLIGAFVGSHVILEKQRDDGVLVNLAGRQRMMMQKMAKESLLLASAAGRGADVTRERDALNSTSKAFHTTMMALKDGGSAPVNLEMTQFRPLPAPTDPATRDQLAKAASSWDPVKRSIEALSASNGKDEGALAVVVGQTGPVTEELNQAVVLLQEQAEKKVSLMLTVQGAALLVGLLIGALAMVVVRRTVATPLEELVTAARTMSRGDLNVKIEPQGSSEIQELGASFERLRASMLATLETAGAGADADL